jgi:hypothetical protein
MGIFDYGYLVTTAFSQTRRSMIMATAVVSRWNLIKLYGNSFNYSFFIVVLKSLVFSRMTADCRRILVEWRANWQPETFALTIQIHTDFTEGGRRREVWGLITHPAAVARRFPCAFHDNHRPFSSILWNVYDSYSEDDWLLSGLSCRRCTLFSLVAAIEFRDCILH